MTWHSPHTKTRWCFNKFFMTCPGKKLFKFSFSFPMQIVITECVQYQSISYKWLFYSKCRYSIFTKWQNFQQDWGNELQQIAPPQAQLTSISFHFHQLLLFAWIFLIHQLHFVQIVQWVFCKFLLVAFVKSGSCKENKVLQNSP